MQLNLERTSYCVIQLKVTMKAITIAAILVSISILHAAAQESCSYYGNVRLVGGSNEREGRVEVCIGGVWGTVCDDSWSSTDARVVCRQLGFEVDVPGAYSRGYCCSRYGRGMGPIFLDRVQCTGQESNLLDCEYNQDEIGNLRYCSHSEDAGVACPSSTCTNGDVRLAGGLDPTEGRVEVCMGGRWSGVCGSNWNYQDAYVVCRQLGYPATGVIHFTSSHSRFRQGVDANFTNFLCYGNESHLLNCAYTSPGSCSRDYTAGVQCYGEIISGSPQCFGDGNVRLVGGASTNEGRVEVCVNGMWGTVCSGSWDSRDATVVCKQLGYQNSGAYPYTSSSVYGAGSGPIVLNGLNCLGSEPTLLGCSRSNPFSCTHHSDAGVQCKHIVYSDCTNGTIRLADGQSANEGRVEICINRVWGSVCDDSWSPSDARVVCRQLALPYTAAIEYYDAYFGRSNGPYHLDEVHCNGSEASLLSCHLGYGEIGVHNCRPGNEAGVMCAALPSCTNHGDVRLFGGDTNFEGRVEICLSGSWVSICVNDCYYHHPVFCYLYGIYTWDSSDSAVFCRQLTGESYTLTSLIFDASFTYQVRSFGPPYFTDPSCSGSEGQLLNCGHSTSSCTSTSTYGVGLRCYVNSTCAEAGVRLAGGRTEMEGRVEVCHNQVWWAVSGSLWDIRDATVVCRHLHYPSNWVIPLSTSHFGRGNATVLVRDLRCIGEEESLQQCTPSNFSFSDFDFGDSSRQADVASVICQSPPATDQPECSSGDLRLVGGERESEGRVEICVEGFWGTICDNGMGREEAVVVCKQLDMQISGALPAYFGEGSGLVISGISCTGTESNVTECSLGRLNCPYGRYFGVICQDTVYMVTVITDPSSGPHPIGSSVNLTCLVHPQPPEFEKVTYQWRDYVSYSSPSSTNSSLPYATLSIGIGHPHTTRYFCQVLCRDQSLGTGSIDITVQSLLHPLSPTLVQFSPQEMVTLRVNITPTASFTRDYLRALTWYYNGVEIVFTSSGTISLSSDNTTLTIANMSESHAGVYEVQFAGLRIYPYNSFCEQETLAVLRHYPLLSTVTFYAHSSDENPFEVNAEESVRGYIKTDINGGSLSYTTSDGITINIRGNAPTTQQKWVSTSWYFNGLSSYPFGTYISSLLKLPTGVTQSLTIDNPTPLHAGTYETLLQLNPSSYLQQFRCPEEYPNFISSSYRAGVGVIILDQVTLDLKYYEPATVSLQSSRRALRDDENTTLSCRADGGYPPTSSISWVKNGRIISRISENQLTINVAASDSDPFGRYVCLVNNSAVTQQSSLLMKQKDDLQVEVDLSNFGRCDNDTQQMIKTQVANLIQELCSCDFTSSDLEQSEATCSADGNSLTFTTAIMYSTDSGNLTASTLIRMFQNKVTSTGAVILVGNQNAAVISVCSPICTPEAQDREPTSLDVAAIGVGAYLGGLLTGIIILTIAAVTVRVVVKRRTPTSKTTETSTKATAATTDKEMVRYASGTLQMGPNIAYGEVEYPEEAIYEDPN